MRFTLAAAAALALLATGCKKDKDETETEDTDTTPPPEETDVTETGFSCGDSSPELVSVDVSNGSTATDVGLAFALNATDGDGGLHQIYYELWVDATPDGNVNTGSNGNVGGPANVVDGSGNPVDPCSITQGVSLRITLPVDGTNIPFDTELDFAWRVLDSDQNPSNIVVSTAYTPKADGSDGGPQDTDPPPDTDTPVDTDTDTGTPPAPTGDTGTPPPPAPTGDTGDTASPPPPAPTGDTSAPAATGDTGI